ncbi:MAG: hypothetical protein CL920_27780 [Deltaproteobacteria bacterium]|nr:hypothetical protein [Deltaproteobacteria bacterium]|tara:strand:- start:1004 stop:1630 length:627 start_codon:yes stop_codon:yes gene_type:complete
MNMQTLQENFAEVFRASFDGRSPGDYHFEQTVRTIASDEHIQDFFDNLELAFDTTLEEDARRELVTIQDCWEWVQTQRHRQWQEEQKAMQEDKPSPFAWQDEITPLQQNLLKLSRIIGPIMFFVGIQMNVRGHKQFGGALAGLGMFIAVQMFWGIKKLFNWFESNQLAYLRRVGYPKLFWFFILGAYALDALGIGLILSILGIPNGPS